MKITRAAFVYLKRRSQDAANDFAQCSSCRLFVDKVKGLTGARCVAHGSKFVVKAGGTCGLYIPWPDGEPIAAQVKEHAEALEKGIAGAVTPEESGYLPNPVQCRRCEYGGGPKCGLYQLLNEHEPGTFDLDENIEPNDCCNAWSPPDGDKRGDADRIPDFVRGFAKGGR